MRERLILLNKPYGVLCQFTDKAGRPTLADFFAIPDLYPAGRLDFDSEGLVLLTNAGWLQERIADPRHKLPKVYWVQVEGKPTAQALKHLEQGIMIEGRQTRPAHARQIDAPEIWPRNPPIRLRKNIPDSWLEITLWEGRKRQVRHMTAAVGYPTLRLIRRAVGPWSLGQLQPGEWKEFFLPLDKQPFW